MTIGDPRLGAVQGGGQNDCSLHNKFCAFLQLLAVPGLFVQSAESQSVVDLGIRYSLHVAELMDRRLLCLTLSSGILPVVLAGGELLSSSG